MQQPEILFENVTGQFGSIGVITLNRPNQLNALTEEMCIGIYRQLQQWEQDENIRAVIVSGAGDRAFCAGGDIRKVYDLRADPQAAKTFFWHEYRMNRAIFHFSKPYIALLNGLTMGGGAGISVNGHYRVATEKLKFAMPETGIGFYPDVGGSYFLPRCPGKLGLYLALTGNAIGVADASYLGLVNYVVKSEVLPLLVENLQNTAWDVDPHVTVRGILQGFNQPETEAPLVAHREKIDNCFAHPEVAAIVEQLQHQADDWSTETAAMMLSRSPISLKITLEQLKRGPHLSFDDCMRMEYRLTNHFLRGHDFFEGVRAQVIDKDRSPKWQPSQLSAVSMELVESYFEKIHDVEDLRFK